jgi:hypothetical protein
MGAAAFTLHPFAATARSPQARRQAAVRIEGTAERRGSMLHLTYRVDECADDPVDTILWPQAEGSAQRRDGLWQHTCLEFFVAHPEEKRYWEFNLSPNGHWNVYSLAGYRHGLEPDPTYSALPFTLQRSGNQLVLVLNCPLPAPLGRSHPLQLAITAVVEHQDASISYWALHHGGREADFHRRDGFQMMI